MNLPLPRDTQMLLAVKQNRREIDNLFLLFYRYVWTWRNDWSLEGTEKKKMMEEVIGRASSSSPAVDYLTAFVERQQYLLAALKDDDWIPWSKELVTDARLIAGLGYKGALEVGLTLHPLYGFPYLPGTAVKGIARAFAELVEKADEDVIREVFGSPEKKPDRAKEFRVGCVRFFDALPSAFPKLEVDVMTPHFTKYYMDGEPPGDWHSPVPVSFLTVAAEQPFTFSLAARGDVEQSNDSISKAEAEAYLHQAAHWLEAGLKDLGAGGKTAAGYGVFLTKGEQETEKTNLTQRAKALRAERAAATFSPPDKWPSVGRNSTNVPAQVLGYEGNILTVRLHVSGYDDKTFKVGKYVGFEKGDWVAVNVANMTRKERVAQISFAGRLSPTR